MKIKLTLISLAFLSMARLVAAQPMEFESAPTAGALTGTVAVGNGGTGQTTLQGTTTLNGFSKLV